MPATAVRASAALLALTIGFTCAPIALAQGVTVNVNGRPLQLSPGPIERAGRVYVPLRGIFERLGASVVYASGTINATRGSATISLQIGSTQATVNGQTQALDAAPFIVGSTTYVPLRFVAQSLGATVGYESSTQIVSIELAHAAPPPNPPPPVRLRAQQPAPQSSTTNRFALIAAEFAPSVSAASVRVWLDGGNVTSRCGISATGFSYKPPAPYDFGAHTIRVSGRGPGGAPFDRSWSFTVRREAITIAIYEPPANAPVGRTFTISGNTVANAKVRVTAGPSPSSSGQFSGETTAGPKGNFKIRVTLTTLLGQQGVTVKVRAADPATNQSAETILRLRLNV